MHLPDFRAFFYMGPPLGPPLLYCILVPFPGPALRFLTAPSLPAQNLPDVGGVIANPEGFGDDLGHPGQGPQIRGEPVGRGPFKEQIQQPRSLSGCQARRPAGRRFGSERIRASGLDLGLPTADGCGRATYLPGHFPHPEAIFDELDGPAAPGFQCGWCPIWSHTWEDTIVPLFTQVSISCFPAARQHRTSTGLHAYA